jgi:hypothetical protein
MSFIIGPRLLKDDHNLGVRARFLFTDSLVWVTSYDLGWDEGSGSHSTHFKSIFVDILHFMTDWRGNGD